MNISDIELDEKSVIFRVLKAVLLALEATIPRNIEIVVHDLEQPMNSVVAIINGHVSGRRKGDTLLSGPDNDIGLLSLSNNLISGEKSKVYSNYYTLSSDGKRLCSASTIFYGKNGRPVIGFCINTDLTNIESLKAVLSMMQPLVLNDHPQVNNVADEMRDIVDNIFSEYLSNNESIRGKRARAMIIGIIRTNGLFKVKDALDMLLKSWGLVGILYTTI